MGTIDYGATPIHKLKRAQLETAYHVAIETRDRALTLETELRDEVYALRSQRMRLRRAVTGRGPVVLAADVLAILDGAG